MIGIFEFIFDCVSLYGAMSVIEYSLDLNLRGKFKERFLERITKNDYENYIHTGQIWKTVDGKEAKIFRNNGGKYFPFSIELSDLTWETVTIRGKVYSNESSDNDLKDLITNEYGISIGGIILIDNQEDSILYRVDKFEYIKNKWVIYICRLQYDYNQEIDVPDILILENDLSLTDDSMSELFWDFDNPDVRYIGDQVDLIAYNLFVDYTNEVIEANEYEEIIKILGKECKKVKVFEVSRKNKWRKS